MPKHLLTNKDDVIAAIDYCHQTSGSTPVPDALNGDDDIIEHFYLKDPADIPPFESEQDVDLQAALDTIDPDVWMASLRQNTALSRDVHDTVNENLEKRGLMEETKGLLLSPKVERLFEDCRQDLPRLMTREHSFHIKIIIPLKYSAFPAELRQHRMTYNEDWSDFLQALQWASVTYDFDSYRYNEGYSIRDGSWQYQIIRNHGTSAHNKTGKECWEKLSNELEYDDMVKKLREDCSANVFVLLAHEKALSCLCIMIVDHYDFWDRINAKAEEITDENGEPYFDPVVGRGQDYVLAVLSEQLIPTASKDRETEGEPHSEHECAKQRLIQIEQDQNCLKEWILMWEKVGKK